MHVPGIHREVKDLDDEVLNWCTLTGCLIRVSCSSHPSLSLFQLHLEKPIRLIYKFNSFNL